MGSALDDLVDDMAALLGAPCTLEDPQFQLIGFSGQREVDTVRQRTILERSSTQDVKDWFAAQGIRDATAPMRTSADPDRGIVARLCIPARHLGRIQGFFWLLDPETSIDETLYPEAMRIADTAGVLLGLSERRQAHRDELYRALVEGRPLSARQAAAGLANAAGLRMDERVTCILLKRPGLPDQLSSRPTRSGLFWVREDEHVSAAVVRADHVRERMDLDELLGVLGLSRRVPSLDALTTVGVGPAVATLDELARSRTGATVALRVAHRDGPGTVMSWADLGPLALLGVARDADLRWALVSPKLERFLADASADLIRTASVFLDEAGSVARTARSLRVHRQTIYHRLRQIEHGTGLDLDDGESRLRLHLALRMNHFLDA